MAQCAPKTNISA